ncbi:type I secretion membrane fusion protein, HlyD [Ahrensia sp. R2A130]|nr:type I secretion membrane fusion protein, HlyD [Ahrensia sp. R2A130]
MSADLLRPRNGLSIALICVLVGTLATGVAWSTQAAMVEVSSGQGRVIPSGRIKLVQNLEGGIVQVIHVDEGERVNKGDLLVSIDPIAAGAVLAENKAAIREMDAAVQWLTALLKDREPQFASADDTGHQQLLDRNRTEYHSVLSEQKATLRSIAKQAEQKRLELSETQGRLSNTKAALVVANEQYGMMAKLRKSRAASRADVLTAKSRKVELEGQRDAMQLAVPRLRAAISEAEARREEQVARFRSRISMRLNEVSAKLASVRQSVAVDVDRVSRAELRSPVNGIIKVLHANTIGQVVKPAENIVEIVPIEDKLLVRVEVSPKDIAFLHPGQEAVVKLTAYDYALYGALKGKVVRIGADSIVDDRGDTHFPVDVRSDVNWLESGEERLPILPGMVATVDIVTGDKTVFDYITKPIHRTATGAFGER